MKVAISAVALVTLLLIPAFAASKAQDTEIVLSKDNTAILNGPVDENSSSDIINQVSKLNVRSFGDIRPSKPIYLFLYTPGGSVQSGLEMIEAVKSSPRPINTITMFAASMGFQIVQNLKERLVLSSGTLMSHHARGGVQGEFGGKPASQVRSRLSFLERVISELDMQTVARTKGKQTLASYTEAYDHEMWLTGSEAVELGFADKVVSVRCDQSLNGTSKHTQNIETPFGALAVNYELSDCPLNTAPQNIKANESSIPSSMTDDQVADAIRRFKTQSSNISNHVLPMRF